MTTPPDIPLSAVAPDAQALIRAFREAGARSFQDVPLAQARENYRLSCRANGVTRAEIARVHDHRIPVQGGDVTLREYRAADGLAPAILFVHGGGWVIGDLETHDPICRFLAYHTGRAVFAVDYRLAPESPFPIPLQDCASALAWLVGHAAQLDLDASRIAAAGDSAGGNLVAVLANTPLHRPEGFDFDRVALMYPVTDLVCDSESYRHVSGGFPLTCAGMSYFSTQYLAGYADRADPSLSPLRAETISSRPHHIVTCGLDPLADEGVAYAARLKAAGSPVEHVHYPDHPHGLLTSAGKMATGLAALQGMSKFLSFKS